MPLWGGVVVPNGGGKKVSLESEKGNVITTLYAQSLSRNATPVP